MRSKPKLLLVHFSDLFYGSGTAVIYRRLLSLLSDKIELHHYISTWRSRPEAALKKRYATDLSITPHFAPYKSFRDIYGRISRRWNGGLPDLRFPGRLDTTNIRKIIKAVEPDIIWWSGDYLPISTYAFKGLELDNTRLLFSLFDPPGFWNSGKWDFEPYFQNILQKANSVDVIGNNMAKLVTDHGFQGKPVILNDYVESILEPKAAESGAFRIAITGQVYGGNMLQFLIDQLNEIKLKSPVEIHWFGNEQNLRVAHEISWPENVKLIERGLLPRDEIASQLQSFDAGYLNMPKETDGFGKYSVPTKMITYLEARLPILFHSPEDSEIEQMNQSYHFGINLGNNSEIIQIREMRAEFQENGGELIKDRYNKANLHSRLIDYLGVSQQS